MTHRDLNFSDQVRLIQLAVGVPVTGQTSNANAVAMTRLTGLSGDQMWKMSTEQFLDHVKNNPDLMAKAEQNMANAGPQHQRLINAFTGGSAPVQVAAAQATAANPGVVQPITPPTVTPAPAQVAPVETVEPTEAAPTTAPNNDVRYRQGLLAITEAPGVSPNDVTGVENDDTAQHSTVQQELLEKATREGVGLEYLTELNQSAGESGGLVSMLQAILKALGFDVNLTGERDAKTEAAIPQATELLGDRDAILEEGVALADDQIFVVPREAGVVINIDGTPTLDDNGMVAFDGGNEMVFDREAVIASDGTLASLINNSPEALASLTADQQALILDRAGIDPETIEVPEAAEETAPGTEGPPTGGQTTNPPEETGVTTSDVLTGAGVIGAAGLGLYGLKRLGQNLVGRVGNGISNLRARPGIIAAQALAAERAGLVAAKNLAEADAARVYARTADVPPRTRTERLFGVSEARAQQFANVEARRAAADAAVERTSFVDADGHPRAATQAELDDIETRRVSRVQTASTQASKAGFFRTQFDRVSTRLSTATDGRVASVTSNAETTSVARQTTVAQRAAVAQADEVARLAPAQSPTVRARAASAVSPRQNMLRLASIGSRASNTALGRLGKFAFGGRKRLAAWIFLGGTAYAMADEAGTPENIHDARLAEAAEIFGADSEAYAEYEEIYAEWRENNKMSEDIGTMGMISLPFAAVSAVTGADNENNTTARLNALFTQHGVDDQARALLSPTSDVPLSLSGELRDWAYHNLDDMALDGSTLTLRENAQVVAAAMEALNNAEEAIEDYLADHEDDANVEVPQDLQDAYFTAQTALLIADDKFAQTFSLIINSPDQLDEFLSVVPERTQFWKLAMAADTMTTEQLNALPGNVGDAMRELIAMKTSGENERTMLDVLKRPDADDIRDRLLESPDALKGALVIALGDDTSGDVHYESAADSYDSTDVSDTTPALALDIPSTADVMEEFASRAVDPDALPEVMAFGADVVLTSGFPPVSAIGDENDVAAYEKAWADNPLAMADAVKEAIKSVAPYLTSAADYKLYLQAVNDYYNSDVSALTRPDGEGAAVRAAVQALGDELGFNDVPVASADHNLNANTGKPA